MIAGLAVGGIFGVLITAVIMLWWKMFQNRIWPIRIPIIRQRGENVVWELDERGRKAKRKDGYEVIKLKKDKENIKPPKYEQVQMDSKGKPVYPLYNTTGGQYFPIKAHKSPQLEVVEDKSAKNWSILEQQRINEAYRPHEGFWDKYGQIVMNATFAAMVIFFVIYETSSLQSIAGTIGGASNNLSNAITMAFGHITTTTTTASVIP